MRRRRARLAAPFAVVALLAATLLSGCAGTGDEAGEDPAPAKLVDVPGQAGVHKVILTPAAAGQIGVKTTEVHEAAIPTTTAAATTAPTAPAAKPLTEVPVTAVIYDPSGRSWTYTVLGPNTYQRAPITVDHVTGEEAFLSSGPAVGTTVVVQGAPELLGAEYGVGEE